LEWDRRWQISRQRNTEILKYLRKEGGVRKYGNKEMKWKKWQVLET
jgi:hypothetical protein